MTFSKYQLAQLCQKLKSENQRDDLDDALEYQLEKIGKHHKPDLMVENLSADWVTVYRVEKIPKGNFKDLIDYLAPGREHVLLYPLWCQIVCRETFLYMHFARRENI